MSFYSIVLFCTIATTIVNTYDYCQNNSFHLTQCLQNNLDFTQLFSLTTAMIGAIFIILTSPSIQSIELAIVLLLTTILRETLIALYVLEESCNQVALNLNVGLTLNCDNYATLASTIRRCFICIDTFIVYKVIHRQRLFDSEYFKSVFDNKADDDANADTLTTVKIGLEV